MQCRVSKPYKIDHDANSLRFELYDFNLGCQRSVSTTINGDSVIGPADVLATNGVIHVIDTVLMPGSDDEPTMGPTAMEESDSAGRASLAVAAAAAVAYVL